MAVRIEHTVHDISHLHPQTTVLAEIVLAKKAPLLSIFPSLTFICIQFTNMCTCSHWKNYFLPTDPSINRLNHPCLIFLAHQTFYCCVCSSTFICFIPATGLLKHPEGLLVDDEWTISSVQYYYRYHYYYYYYFLLLLLSLSLLLL